MFTNTVREILSNQWSISNEMFEHRFYVYITQGSVTI